VPKTVPKKISDEQNIHELFQNREFSKAETLIKQQLEKKPDCADSHYLLGVSNYLQGNIGQSIENLNRAISIDPKHTRAAICLSILLNDIGKYEEAKKIYEKANQSLFSQQSSPDAETNKKFSIKHLELADLYFRYRRYDEAIEEYRKAASLDPTTTEIRIRLAKAYAKKGFVSRAIQELQQLKSEKPSDVHIRIQLGLLHYSQENVLDAELEWEAAADIAPNNREILTYLDLAKEVRGKKLPTSKGG